MNFLHVIEVIQFEGFPFRIHSRIKIEEKQNQSPCIYCVIIPAFIIELQSSKSILVIAENKIKNENI